MASETVGSYEILRECGRGSCGVVYLARSAISGDRVALKLLDRAHEDRELEGLIRCRECRHANLIRIRHLDRLPDGRLYYTMDVADDVSGGGEYIPDTLAARGRVAPEELKNILNALLDGLEVLHAHKLVHRDIKPENILFVGGIPVLGDIGLAAVFGAASLAGTPPFLPPEVLTGARPPDAASDLYALGRVAYVALTGLPPHRYPRLPKGLPPEAAPVLAFCRAANSDGATLAECRAALNAPPRSKFRRFFVGASIVAAAVAAAAVAVFAGRSASMPTAPPPEVPAPQPSVSPPRNDAALDVVLKNTEAELTRKMRQLDREVAASQAKMREETRQFSPEEYRAAVAELEKKYPIPEELRRRAKARCEAADCEYARARSRLSPFRAEDAAAISRLDDERARLEAEDRLYRIGKADSSIEFSVGTFSTTRRGADLRLLESMYRERRDAVAQLTEKEKP